MQPLLAPFRPRVLNALRGYDRAGFLKDLAAGVTVGIVALPLAMAFAIASGLKPEAGLWTSIIAGTLVAMLGGSNVQIAGPAGAFIVIVYGIVERHGVANLLIATACAGVLLFACGLLRLGTLVRYVPVGIVAGFTNGIAILIALSQLRDLLGLPVARMPADFFSLVGVVGRNLPLANPYALALGLACLAGLFAWPRLWSRIGPATPRRLHLRLDVPGMQQALRTTSRMPAPIVALCTLTLLAWALELPVETVGSRFGGIPQSVPAFALPDFSWETVKLLVGPTLTIAGLGAIESLLCARVADQLGHLPRHDPNQELMAQGIANAVVPFFGGMPATGTIARTVTNVRSGGRTPIAGVVHAATIAAVVLIAAPLAVHIPLAVLAGILLFVAWNMGEWRELARALRPGELARHHVLLMLGTLLLTVVFDLTVALQVGLVAACALFIRRMSALFRIEPLPLADAAADPAAQPVRHFRLFGALFFGAVAKVDAVAQQVEAGPRGVVVVLDAHQLVALDASGLDALRQLHQAVQHRGGVLRIESLPPQPAALVERSGFAAELAAQPGAPVEPQAARPANPAR